MICESKKRNKRQVNVESFTLQNVFVIVILERQNIEQCHQFIAEELERVG